MIRLLLIPSLLLLQTACGKSPSNSTSVSANAPTETSAGWKVYEDDWFKVLYPEGSNVGGGAEGKQNPKFPVLGIVPKAAGEGIFGVFPLQFDTLTRGMLLRDAIQTAIARSTKSHGKLLFPPREVKLKNGRCLSAITNTPSAHCPKDQGDCFSPSILTLCDDSAGRRYSADSLLSQGNDPKSLSPQAQQEAATYERILRSLEFKKS